MNIAGSTIRSALVALLCLALLAPNLGSTASPAPLKGEALNGIWARPQGVNNIFKQGENPPYNAEWAKKNEELQKRRLAGQDIDDPSLRCLPFGMPRMMISATYPFEILVTSGQITVIQELDSEVRRIFVDQKHPPAQEERDPTFQGHSIGHWEGDTLVVDTVNIRSETPIDRLYYPRSDKMHITERWRLQDRNTLEVEITLHDPVAFVRPWSTTKRFVRQRGEYIHEYVCTENNERVQPLVTDEQLENEKSP